MLFGRLIKIHVTLRSPATLTKIPLTVMPVLRGMRRKQRGGWRLLYKAYLALFGFFYRTLRMPVRGTMSLSFPEGATLAQVDLSNLQYLYLPIVNEAHVYEPRVTALFDYLAPHISVVYDVGSNWGYYAASLATNPQFTGQIHAFEIAPRTFQDLKVVANELDRRSDVQVICHQIGLSDKAGTVRVRHHFFSGMTMIASKDDEAGELLPVAKMDELGLDAPDLIKIDVEGHEAAVLRGAREILSCHHPVIVMENWFNQDQGKMLESLQILADEGYLVFHPAWETVAGDRMAYTNEAVADPNREQTLCLLQISPETRPLTTGAPDVIAIHPSRLDDFFPDTQLTA